MHPILGKGAVKGKGAVRGMDWGAEARGGWGQTGERMGGEGGHRVGHRLGKPRPGLVINLNPGRPSLLGLGSGG